MSASFNFRELDISALEGDGAVVPHESEAGSRNIGSRLSLYCRDRNDLKAFTIDAHRPRLENFEVRLSHSGLAEYVRLYLPALPIKKFSAAIFSDVLCQVEIKIRNNSISPLPIDWLALTKKVGSSHKFFQKFAEQDLLLPTSESVRTYRFLLNELPGPGDDLYVGIHIPAGPVNFQIERFRIRVLQAGSTRGVIDSVRDGLVRGWSSIQPDVSVSIVDGSTREELARTAIAGGCFAVPVFRDEHRAPIDGKRYAILHHGTDPIALYDVTHAMEFAARGEQTDSAELPAESAAPETELLRRLHKEGAHERIWYLHSQIEQNEPAIISRHDALLRIYNARTMLDLNASDTAYNQLSHALSFDGISALLGRKDYVNAKELLANACLRSGRPEEAKVIFDTLRLEHPFNWKYYFLSANSIGSSQPKIMDAFYETARRVAKEVPPGVRMVFIERLIANGALSIAMPDCVLALKSNPDAYELWLTLGNIYLALGDRKSWHSCLERFFASLQLVTPTCDVNISNSDDVYVTFKSPYPAEIEQNLADKSVAVIMTSFNSAASIGLAIHSVLAQSHRNLQVIVVDDVSTDGTPEIVESIAEIDPRVRLIRNPINMGTYCAKNRAIASCDPDYYAFHDSDDWMHPQRITEHLRYMEENPSLVCTTSSWFRMDQRGYAMVRRGGGYIHDNPASTFFRREVIENLGFFDSVRTGADSEFVWRVRRRFGRKSVKRINKPLAIGLHHSQSLTQSGATAFDENRYSAVRLRYWESWIAWHRQSVLEGRAPIYMAFPNMERSFAAPEEILTQGLETIDGLENK